MMQRSRANEIDELIARLGSRSRARVDAAQARLLIIGERAVESLIDALEGSNGRIRARVMPLLAMIRDTRGREPLIAMLLDRNHRLRIVAARCLARFPAGDSVAALNRVALKDRNVSVRIAAVHSLVEQYAAGHERAIRVALDRLLDTDETLAVRLAALPLVRALQGPDRQGILDRLRQDPDEEFRLRAAEQENDAPTSLGEDEIAVLIERLGSQGYAAWTDAVTRLGGCGEAVAAPLISALQRQAHDPEFCTRAGMALKALGPRNGRAVADALDDVDEPLVLQVLVGVVGAWGEKSIIYRLKDVIERLADLRDGQRPVDDPMQRVRARAHLELSRIGSRVAIRDLRDALSDGGGRVELEMLGALGAIGKREELPPLLRAWVREDRFMRERVAAAVRSIVKRERIRRNDRLFGRLSEAERRALVSILPPFPGGRRRRRHAEAG